MTSLINLNKKLVSKKLILNHIQDIDVYRYYTGQEVELKKRILSPLREEEDPSFGYFIGENNEVCFNDFLLGGGDFVKFVELYFGINYFEALSKIVIDFNLHHYFFYKSVDASGKKYNKNQYLDKNDILKKANNFTLGKQNRSWKSYDLSYWLSYGIDYVTLLRYSVSPIKFIFINNQPISADKHAYCYLEAKDNKITYKIYQPFNDKYKWLNKHDSSVWQGWQQLPKTGNQLIITKSLKDVMSIRCMLGLPAVALQAEGIKPKPHIINELKDRFKTIYILYDNDFDKKENWGQLFSNELANEYGLINLVIPDEFKCKDFSDLVKYFYLNTKESNELFYSENALVKQDKKLTLKEKINIIWQTNIQMPF